MNRLDQIRQHATEGKAAVALGTTCTAAAILIDDIEWLITELEARP